MLELQKKFYLARKYYNVTLTNIFFYFCTLSVAFHDYMSLFGFFTFLIIANQLISGTMLAFSLVPEPMMVPLVRDEEDVEDLYTDDFFWLHERGVDLLFIFVFFHLFRKLYLVVLDYEQEFAWKSGAFAFLIIQMVVFLGLVLCCTHLSEVTLTIAANALHTAFFFKGKAYWWLFTDKFLNTDTLIRLAYAHYVAAFFLAFLGVIHGLDMHYDWKNENSLDGLRSELIWWDEALSNEFSKTIDVILLVGFCCFFLYTMPEALTYEIFMWGDVGMSTDVRFTGVAPHWYFRPYMAWLIVCPSHKPGLFGLVYFFFAIFYQPNLHGMTEMRNYKINSICKKHWTKYHDSRYTIFDEDECVYIFKSSRYSVESSLWHQITYSVFIMSVFYTTTFLPFGKFYNRLGGNVGMLLAYLYVFAYLGLPSLKKNVTMRSAEVYLYSILHQYSSNTPYTEKTDRKVPINFANYDTV
jgi:quinol-cytochrome oxidoreductase complex cytochrome b subunit